MGDASLFLPFGTSLNRNLQYSFIVPVIDWWHLRLHISTGTSISQCAPWWGPDVELLGSQSGWCYFCASAKQSQPQQAELVLYMCSKTWRMKKKIEKEGKGNLGRCTLLPRMASAEDLQKERSGLIFRKLFSLMFLEMPVLPEWELSRSTSLWVDSGYWIVRIYVDSQWAKQPLILVTVKVKSSEGKCTPSGSCTPSQTVAMTLTVELICSDVYRFVLQVFIPLLLMELSRQRSRPEAPLCPSGGMWHSVAPMDSVAPGPRGQVSTSVQVRIITSNYSLFWLF